MSETGKNKLEDDSGGRKLPKRQSIHHSGVSMPRSLFAQLDRIAKLVTLRGRVELLVLSITIVLDMCEDHSKRYLPDVILRYDKNRPTKEVAANISVESRMQRAGTHFSRTLEERIARLIKPIGWSRNQFIIEAVKTIVQWCEDPSARTVPVVVLLYDAATSPAVKLKRRP
jgi:hypothetical protein